MVSKFPGVRSRLNLAVAALLLPACALADNADNNTSTLETVQVKGLAKQSGINYTVPASSAATGMKLTQRETPQSLSVLTEKQIDDQSLNTLQDALKQVPGVFHSKMGNNATGDSKFISRGEAIDTLTVDGAAEFFYDDNTTRRFTNNLDSALYEEVTVVRGANGLAEGGMGQPGGTVSLTRKKPKAQSAVSLEAGVGSWRHLRFVADANGALNAGKSLLGRVIFVSDHGGDYLPRAHRRNHTLYGMLTYAVTPQTQIGAGAELHINRSRGSSRFGYLTIAGNPAAGFKPFDADPRNNSSADWAYARENSREFFTTVKHEFNNGWILDGRYSYSAVNAEKLSGIAGTFSIRPDYSTVVSTFLEKSRLHKHSLTLGLSGSYPLLGRQHDFAGGISYANSKDTPDFYDYAQVPIADLRRFDGHVEQPESPYLEKGIIHSKSLSAHASTRFKLTERWALLAGGRLTRWQYRTSTDDNSFADERYADTVFTPHLGTTYEISPQLSAYGSYGTVFRPQLGTLDVNGKTLEPQRGATYETGIKGAWFDGRLNAAASLFQTRKSKLPVKAGQHASGKEYYRAADHARTNGWELSLNGRINERWLLNASYTRAKTKDSDGKQLAVYYPEHLVKFFTSYDINDRLTVGGNLNWQSFITDDRPEVTEPAARAALAQRAYATVDLMASYQIGKNLRLRLNADNIFNKKYKTMPDIHVYGTPRSFTASVRYTF